MRTWIWSMRSASLGTLTGPVGYIDSTSPNQSYST